MWGNHNPGKCNSDFALAKFALAKGKVAATLPRVVAAPHSALQAWLLPFCLPLQPWGSR